MSSITLLILFRYNIIDYLWYYRLMRLCRKGLHEFEGTRCLECNINYHKEYRKAHYEVDKNLRKEYKKAWIAANKDRISVYRS